ncbi:MAG: hypothetical protein BWY59_00783 [Verrucomicrobia bacterium ADurb.Bin345]|jgi:hypothetical protein|nr:MAG: hypothetical protein BWY59_00783 [Verrucomicrobia bacterium ADurb.Bin345]
MPDSNPLCGLLHCQHPLDPNQTDVQFVSPSDSHYELMEIARQLEGIRLILEAMFNASQQLQLQAQAYLLNQTTHAESFIGRLDVPDYYPFIALPPGTTVTDQPDGGRQFILPGGVIILVRTDHTVFVIHDGRAINVDISLGGNVLLPNGQAYQVHQDYLVVTQTTAGIEGLPPDIQPVCIGRGRYRTEFSDGVVLTIWHALPADDLHPVQECMLHAASPTGGILVVSRKGVQGIGIEVQVRLLADGSLGFRVLPDGNKDTVQYLHAGTARPMQGVVELALSNGTTITYRCGRSPDDTGGGDDDGNGSGSGNGVDASTPVTFQCEERGQCSL